MAGAKGSPEGEIGRRSMEPTQEAVARYYGRHTSSEQYATRQIHHTRPRQSLQSLSGSHPPHTEEQVAALGRRVRRENGAVAQARREDMVQLGRDGSQATKAVERHGRRPGTEWGATTMEVDISESSTRPG